MVNSGSTLILVVIIIALITVLGMSILNISMNHYKIMQSNSEVKKAFYMAEDGLNRAYLRIFDLICEASEDSVEKADEYLEQNPEDYSSASNIFINNYKLYILSFIKNRAYNSDNPYTEVVNKSSLVFVNDELTVEIKSKYLSKTGIEKSLVADIIISIPNYADIKAGTINYISLICFRRFYLWLRYIWKEKTKDLH